MTTVQPRTRLDPDERRAQILAVAISVFRSSDYSTVSLDSIADAAGVTRGLLHHYFGSKRALYLEAMERTLHVPADTQLVPDDAGGTLEEVLSASVDQWLNLVEPVGGLWAGLAGTTTVGDTDIDRIFISARDELVERMIDQIPISPALDREMLRGALRSYSAFARVAIDEWLIRGTLDRQHTHNMLTATLLAIVTDVVPAMSATTAVKPLKPARPRQAGSKQTGSKQTGSTQAGSTQ